MLLIAKIVYLLMLCGCASASAPSLRGNPGKRAQSYSVTNRFSLREEVIQNRPDKEIVSAASPMTDAYSSGWWYAEVTSSHTCDTDDFGGENDPTSIEGYALNVCIFEGGTHVRYQCDGASIIQELYSNSNCSSYTGYYPVNNVGCRDNIIYNCTAENSTFPIPAGQKFVTQLYYETSYAAPNCTGQVQYFVGQANEHCFATPSGSQYNDYPEIKVYPYSSDCTQGFYLNEDIHVCTIDEAIATGGQISYTHFNTTLIAGPPNHPPPDSDGDSNNDDFFDNEDALIGVAVGGGAAVLLAMGAGYYLLTKPAETLLTGAAGSSA